MPHESTLLILLIILTLGLFIPELVKKFRLPFITIIILSGALFGENGLGIVQPNEIVEFFGFLGITFLMLLAGLETDLSKLQAEKGKILLLALLNGAIPFVFGFVATLLFGYSVMTALLVGIIFISSSVAIIVPSLHNSKKLKKDVFHIMLAAVMIMDIVSLIVLGLIFQNSLTVPNLPTYAYILVLIGALLFVFFVIPKFSNLLIRKKFFYDNGYEEKLRFVLVILIGTLTLFTLLGMHPILASFLAGLALSSVIKKDTSGIIMTKLHTLGYGLFVPVFFFIVGMELDLSLLQSFDIANVIMLVLIGGMIICKFFSGYIGSRLIKFSRKDALLFGSISITQLTTTLAVTYSAESLGLLDSTIVSSVIILAIVTTFLGPLMASTVSTMNISEKKLKQLLS